MHAPVASHQILAGQGMYCLARLRGMKGAFTIIGTAGNAGKTLITTKRGKVGDFNSLAMCIRIEQRGRV